MNRLEEIKQRVDELQHATLHGPIPLKTTMQLVEDIIWLHDTYVPPPQFRNKLEQLEHDLKASIKYCNEHHREE